MAVEPWMIDVAGITDLPQLPEIFYAEFDEDYESDDLSDFGEDKREASISINRTKLSLKIYSKRLGLPNFSMFNKWKKV